MVEKDVLWVIKFNSTDRQDADLYIPAPPSFGGWIKTNPQHIEETESIECLNQIQAICETLKNNGASQENIHEAEEYLNHIKDVSNKLGDLETIIEKFNSFLKRINHPPFNDSSGSQPPL